MADKHSKIGVFDSGLGGISVLRELKKELPNEDFLYIGDSAFAPYGTKDKQAIIDRCIHICDTFIKEDVKAILIACNTATSAAANLLREKYDLPIIGMEPALKVAAHNKTNQKIIVMATELTLKEKKFNDLMTQYNKENTIIKMPCPELVEIIENDKFEDSKFIIKQLHSYYENIDIHSIDSIVLGCTHFVFYRPYFLKYFSNIHIVDGNHGTVQHLKNVLKDTNMLNDKMKEGNIEIRNTSDNKAYITLSHKLLKGGI